MATKQHDDRTGKYGGDDGALEHERTDHKTSDDPARTGQPGKATTTPTAAEQAERKQQRDLETGEENPGG